MNETATINPAVCSDERPFQTRASVSCHRCHYDLGETPIERHAETGLLVARCPKCNSLVPIDVYPLRTAGAIRWRRVAAVAWLVIMNALFWSTALICGIVILQGVFIALENIESKMQLHFDYQYFEVQGINRTSVDWSAYYAALDGWRGSDSAMAFVHEQGGYFSMIGWPSMWSLLPLVPMLFAGGVIWSLLLWEKSRLFRFLFAISTIVVGASLLIPVGAVDYLTGVLDWERVLSEAFPVTSLVTATLVFFPFAAGSVFGRSLTRCVVSLLLPPRSVRSLANLWTCDGLSLPSIETRQNRSDRDV